jgi:hypothetical protein
MLHLVVPDLALIDVPARGNGIRLMPSLLLFAVPPPARAGEDAWLAIP